MAISEELKILITADTQTATRNLAQFENVQEEVVSTSEEMKQGIGGLGQAIIVANQGFELAAKLIRGLKKATDELVGAYAVQEAAERRRASVLKATNNAVGASISELDDWASSLSLATGIADEAIVQAQSLLLTFKEIEGNTFPRATEAAADMAAIMGQDLQSAILQVGIALNDPIGGIGRLSRAGVQFSDEQKEMIKGFVEMNDMASAQDMILRELESQFGGVAVAMRDTAEGSMTAFNNAIGDLKETIGAGLEEALRPGREAFINWVNENQETIGAIFSNLPEIARIAGDTAIQVLGRTFSGETIQQIFAALGQYIQAAIVTGFENIGRIFQVLHDTATDAAEALGEDWLKHLINGITANFTRMPAWLLSLLGIGEGQAWEPFETTGPSVGEAIFDSLKQNGEEFLNAFRDNIQATTGNLETLLESVGSNYTDIFEGAKSAIDEVIEAHKLQNEEIATGNMLLGETEKSYIDTSAAAAAISEELALYAEYLKETNGEMDRLKEEFMEVDEILSELGTKLGDVMVQGALDLIKEWGKEVGGGTADFDSVIRSMISQLPQMLLSAGLMAIAQGHFWVGMALLTASGLAAFAVGAMEGQNESINATAEATPNAIRRGSNFVSPGQTVINNEYYNGSRITMSNLTNAVTQEQVLMERTY